jgi:tetratricopeptide (TPR) repeat protein
LSLLEQIPDAHAAAVCAFNLGHAYTTLPEIRDLALAERWYGHSLELRAKEDHMGRAQCLAQLGLVDYERFSAARNTNRPFEERLGHLSTAEQYYKQALEMLPANAVRELAITHNQLGNIYGDAGQIDTALRHQRESIRYFDAMQDRFAAGQARSNAAATLARAGRFADAREWAQSALRDFEASENPDQYIVLTLKLLEQIESDLQATSPPS